MRRGDAHQLAGVPVGGDGFEGLSQQGLTLEDLDQPHDGDDADRDRQLDRSHVHTQDVDGFLRDGRRERAVVAAPDVLRHREEEEAEDDGEQDPPFALLLQRQPHRSPFDEEAQGRAEEQAGRHNQPVGKTQHDQREREGR